MTASYNEQFPRDRDGKFILTQKVKIDSVKCLDEVPSHWPVPKIDTAYVLNFTDDERLTNKREAVTGKVKGLDVFLRLRYMTKTTLWYCSVDSNCQNRIKTHGAEGQTAALQKRHLFSFSTVFLPTIPHITVTGPCGVNCLMKNS